MKALRLVAVLYLATTIRAGAQAARAPGHDASWVAPETAAAKLNPIANRPELAAGGRKIFEQRCAMCHGSGAKGTERAPGLLTRRVQSETDGALFWKISSGNTRTGMPTFSFLPPMERWQLVLHLRSLAAARAVPQNR